MKAERQMISFTVCLNGTDENPYRLWGLTQNPFPKLAKHEYVKHILHVQALGGEPIPDVSYIRQHLIGYSSEFVDLCCRMFKKGEMVKFEVYF